MLSARFTYQMFCILPCAGIKDKVALPPVGSASSIAPQMDPIRAELRKMSDIEYLLGLLQEGEVVMSRKVSFDNYLKSQVDLMRAYVSTSTPCNFVYAAYFGGPDIDANGLNPRDQWALEIVMSRLNLSSIYHAGAYNSMRTIFTETGNSYREGCKPSPELIKTVHMTFQYFNEGYQPLKRLLPYFDSVESLASPSTRSSHLQLKKTMFETYTMLVTCNLAYLKIEKYRQLREFKKAKEACWAVFLRMGDCKARLTNACGQFSGSTAEMAEFFDLGGYFYQVLAYYFMLVEHEENKNNEDYGFIKKEFQQMIHDNLVACDEAEKIVGQAKASLKEENDNVIFGLGVMAVALEEIKKFKYRYNISVHENKSERPSIQQVIARRIGASSIWESLEFF